MLKRKNSPRRQGLKGIRAMMEENVYLIAWELHGAARNEASPQKVISAYRGKKQKLMHSAWLVKTEESEEEIYNKLRPHFGPTDRCIVLLVSRGRWKASLPRILQKITLWMAM